MQTSIEQLKSLTSVEIESLEQAEELHKNFKRITNDIKQATAEYQKAKDFLSAHIYLNQHLY